MAKGFLSIILHAHLPYVHHPEHERFFEENWLFEALTESYIPLIMMLDRFEAEQVDCRITLSISPPLMTMLRDELLRNRYLDYLHRCLELTEKELIRTRNEPALQKLARLYRRFFLKILDVYQNRYAGDILNAFIKHHAGARLELITCAATHGFLPLLNASEIAVKNQIKIALELFQAQFGFKPAGFWLPECGYYHGLENILKEQGIKYFFTDAHGVLGANPLPQHGTAAPLNCGNEVFVFARDVYLSHQVWSAQSGYPGDSDYREYYWDIGHDLPLDYIAPYILDGNYRINTGIKYHRVTGGAGEKAVYDPRQALAKAKLHARDFLDKCQAQLDQCSLGMASEPILVTPFDAELYGHWWFEGPYWLEQVIRLAAQGYNRVALVSPDEYLSIFQEQQKALPAESSWGEMGYSAYWINDSNAWIYPLLNKAEAELEKMVAELAPFSVTELQRRALNQAVRSVLLAQASDWAFILKSGTTVEYAKKRITDHLARFNYLHDCIRKNVINERYLCALEIMDNIFPDLDFRSYAPNSRLRDFQISQHTLNTG